MIEIHHDTSAVPALVKENSPKIYECVQRDMLRRTFWRWLEDGKLYGARLVFRRLLRQLNAQ